MSGLEFVPWSEAEAALPKRGRHLCACHDRETVTVFAAHNREIASWATEKGQFGGWAWRGDRITRFRLSFPRVMARSEQGEREGREVALAITLNRRHFDGVLRQAVHWREFPEELFEGRAQWRLATRFSQVVMDWAPDSDPMGRDLARFTVRFGVRNEALTGFSKRWPVTIRSLEEVSEAWRNLQPDDDPPTPLMRPYPVTEPDVAERLLWEPAG